MFILILLTFAVFSVLWLGDAWITREVTEKVGPEAEINPIMEKILSVRGRFVWLFKAVEIGVFLYLIYYLTTFSGVISFYVLLGYILFYGLLVANNSRVYYNVTGEASRAFRAIFVILLIVSVSFIYLNKVFYDNLTYSYSSLEECNSKYQELHRECKTNETTPASFSEELEERLEGLKLGTGG